MPGTRRPSADCPRGNVTGMLSRSDLSCLSTKLAIANMLKELQCSEPIPCASRHHHISTMLPSPEGEEFMDPRYETLNSQACFCITRTYLKRFTCGNFPLKTLKAQIHLNEQYHYPPRCMPSTNTKANSSPSVFWSLKDQ
jgi:hypothetical protein